MALRKNQSRIGDQSRSPPRRRGGSTERLSSREDGSRRIATRLCRGGRQRNPPRSERPRDRAGEGKKSYLDSTNSKAKDSSPDHASMFREAHHGITNLAAERRLKFRQVAQWTDHPIFAHRMRIG